MRDGPEEKRWLKPPPPIPPPKWRGPPLNMCLLPPPIGLLFILPDILENLPLVPGLALSLPGSFAILPLLPKLPGLIGVMPFAGIVTIFDDGDMLA